VSGTFIQSQTIQADGVHVIVCANVSLGDGPFTSKWSSNGTMVVTTNGLCAEIVFNPLAEGVPIAVNVLNACGGGNGSGSISTTCGICLSRGTPSLLSGITGSGTVPNLPSSNCGITNSSTAKWFKLVVTNDTGLVTLSTEGSASSNTTLTVFTGPITS